MLIDKMTTKMMEKGYVTRVVPIEQVAEIGKEFQKLEDCGLLAQDIRNIVGKLYECDFSKVPFPVKSVIITASPCYMAKVHFIWHGKRVPLIIPPTYLDFLDEPQKIKKDLQEILADDNYHIEITHNLPVKLIAAKSGLSKYGKNNIGYISGMGSFAMLSAFSSDLPCDKDNWNDISMMDCCKTCNACVNSCPTGAIRPDRFLVQAEKCITYHNEFSGEIEFPKWISPSAHNSIVGCMHCQTCCPVNSRYLKNVIELEDFNADETELIVKGIQSSDLPSETIEKIKRLNLMIYYDKLSRNISALLKA